MNDTVYGVLHNHRSLMSIKENRAVLEHELNKARAGFGPRVDVTGEIGVGVLSDTTSRGLNLDDQWLSVGSVSAKLVQPIWDGFATRSRVRAAQATLDSVKARIFDTATSLSLDGIIAHIDLLRRIKLVELARNNVARHESILAQARDRASMGADTQADVTQAESRLQRAHSALAEAEDALRVAYATYSRLTGIYTVGKLDAVPMLAEMPDTAAAFIQMAEKHNPKLAAYLQDIRAAKGEKELAQSAMYPTFQLEAGPEYSDRGGDRDRWVYSFNVLATVRWNVFNSGADVEGIRAASAREREARQNLYDYMDTLRLDMESTWSNYLAAKEQYKFYTKAVENNTYTRQAYHDQFLLGTRSLLDVLDSENELYNSASQAETARGNILVGAYRMCAL
ncbi:TolC family protein, partial [Desulfovibrio sp.]|uniref:TolC family protein n=1 Tax=Desulfovibrio sp. TaxID=885 RepID=UPI00307B9A47